MRKCMHDNDKKRGVRLRVKRERRQRWERNFSNQKTRFEPKQTHVRPLDAELLLSKVFGR